MRKADIVTLVGGSLTGLALITGLLDEICLAVKLLLLAYLMDVIDGWVARKYDEPDERGQMLDRVLDRLSQVVVPFILFTATYEKHLEGYSLGIMYIYVSIMIPAIFYRLVYRARRSLDYFPGTPLFVHALILLGAVIYGSYHSFYTFILLGAALGTALNIPYFRRRTGSGPSPAVAGRAIGILLLVAIPCASTIWQGIGIVLLSIGVLYAAVGWIIYLVLSYGEDTR
ncbi:MAG: CDP-alcohol phosphatidyltransferase family protein [Desulfurococcales archaeon]|nr:CDP-alcohol phosphatidyltransferase family protein [Desulfurococcales archaeon]